MSAEVAYKAWVDQGVQAGLEEELPSWEKLAPKWRDRWMGSIAAVRRSLRKETIDASRARDGKAVADAAREARTHRERFVVANRDGEKARGQVAQLKRDLASARQQIVEANKTIALVRGGEEPVDEEETSS